MYLEDSGLSLPVVPSRTNLKLYNILATPKSVKMTVSSLDSANASSPDWTPVVVLNNCGYKRSYKLVDLFNMCWSNIVFQVVERSYLLPQHLKCWGETCSQRSPSTVLSVDSKIFEKFVTWNLWSPIEMRLYSNIQYGFRYCRSIVDLLTVVLDSIAKTFHICRVTKAVTLDAYQAFERV